MNNGVEASRSYYAFISYRHADNKTEGRCWATWLHQAIETYEIPEDLVGQTNLLGVVIPNQIFPIFRDEEELPADANLSGAITRALYSSRFLIVLCSPRAVKSTYVGEEIEYFKQLGRSDHIIAAIIDGEPNVSQLNQHFSEINECFHSALLWEYDEQGDPTHKRVQPVAADFRILEDGIHREGWTSSEAYRQEIKNNGDQTVHDEKVAEYAKQQHLMLLKIIAAILGVPLADLTQRDQAYQLEREKQKANRLRKWLSAVSILAFFVITAGITAYYQQTKAQMAEENAYLQKERVIRERDTALITQSNFLMDLAAQENKKHHYSTALLLGLNAVPGLYGGVRPKITKVGPLRLAVVAGQKQAIFRHDDSVRDLVLSPNGDFLVTASDDETVVLWRLKSGAKVFTFKHDNVVNSVAFSPNGQWLVTASDDKTAVLWNSQTGAQQYTFQHDFAVHHIAFSQDGQWIVTTSKNNTAIIWSASTGKKKHVFVHEDRINAVNFSPDGQQLVTASDDNTAVLWQILSGKKLLTFYHLEDVNFSDFSPDGQQLVTASDDETAAIWSVLTGEKQHSFQHEYRVRHAKFNPNGRSIITSSNHAFIWDTRTGDKVYVLKHKKGVKKAFFSHDGFWVFTQSRHTIGIWDSSTGVKEDQLIHRFISSTRASHDGQWFVSASTSKNNAILWRIQLGTQRILFNGGGKGRRRYSALSPDGESVVTSSENGETRVWQARTGLIRHSFWHKAGVNYASFSPDGQWVVSTASDGDATAVLRSMVTGDVIHTFNHQRSVDKGVFSPDSTLLLTASWDTTAVLWSVDNGQKLHTFYHDNIVKDARFSPDGQLILLASSKTVTIWNVHTAEKYQSFLHNGYVEHAVFSPDGKWVVCSLNNNSAVLWNVATGEIQSVFNHMDDINRSVFSPDSQFIVTVSMDRTAVLWDLTTGNKIHFFEHSGIVTDASFSGNGEWIVTASRDKTISLWNRKTGDKMETYLYDSPVTKVSFCPDETCILVVAEGSTILERIMPMLPSQLVLFAQSKLPLNHSCLTPKERKRYFLSELTDEQWIERACPQFSSLSKKYSDTHFTPLVGAVKQGDIAMVDALSDDLNKVNLNISGLTPLHMNVLSSTEVDPFVRQEIVSLLLEKGAEIDVSDSNGQTPLHYAVSSHLSNLIKVLINKGADINSTDHNGWTPLIYAVKSGFLEGVEILTEENAGLNLVDSNDQTALHHTVRHDSLGGDLKQAQIALFLIEKGADVNAKNKFGSTVIASAVSNQNYAVLDVLIKVGSDVNEANNAGVTPLMKAVYKENFKLIEGLLKAGADVNRVNKTGMSALHFVANSKEKNIPKLLNLLLDAGANVDEANNAGVTPLMFAIVTENFKLIEELLKAGAGVNQVNKAGMSALHFVVRSKEKNITKLINLLLDAGADINLLDLKGISPLMRAVHGVRIELVSMLLKAGANPNSTLKQQNYTILGIALKMDDSDKKNIIIQLLKRYGAV